MNHFGLYKLILWSAGANPKYEWKILETFETSDGLRSRICDGIWENETNARVAFNEKITQSQRERGTPVNQGNSAIPKSSMTTLLPPKLLHCTSQDKCDWPSCTNHCPHAHF